jgi:DNA-binding CsgD family transcriptional regulator
MDTDRRTLLDLIAALHKGAAEERPWAHFLRQLRLALVSHSANLVLREADAAPDEVFAVEDYAAAPPPLLRERYFEEFYRDDPFPYFQMAPARVYRLRELLRDPTPEASSFFTGYLRPAGIANLLIFHAAEPGGCRAWVTVTRGPGSTDFSAAELALCEDLALQLGISLGVFAALQEERLRRQLYENAARKLNVDFLLLDAHGKLLLAQDQAARIKGLGFCLASDGRLHAPTQEHDAGLQRAVAQARDARLGQVLHICDAPYLDVFVSPIAHVQPPLGRETPAIVLYLHAGPIQVASSHLEKLFGLSSTEARLAAALVRGRTLTQAAADIGVTEQTARRYSKLIFGKTGANRQSELVRRILGSGAILAK